ncbi:MAG: hypothetical protein ING19_19075 [Azospirillum sp.]|jgi:hypothetical protein|nr:hypothetical protein [Azospirillum sp.]MCA3268170.1 hypothetical protein [Azospirillum sp.]MCZ8122680.1 hypothetical protein [Magnetospirillum sp.]
MRKPLLLVLALLVLAAAGFAAFLATWEIPAPTARIEKVIPNDRLPR